MQNQIEYFFFRIFFVFIRLFTFRAVQQLGSACGAFVYSVTGFRKSLVLDNLRHAYPEKNGDEIRKIAKASYRNLFTAFFEIMYMDKMSEKKITSTISFADADKIPALLKRGKGLIILTGHFANWELCALAVPVFVPEKYTIVVQTQRNPYVNEFMTAMRSRFGTKLVGMERSLRESLRALSKNEAVALIADQSGPESGIYANFFGRPVSTQQGPAVFQLRTGAPILMLMLIREGPERFRIEAEEIDTENLNGTDEKKMAEITQRHVTALERYIRRYPEQWLWMHRRWKYSGTPQAKEFLKGAP